MNPTYTALTAAAREKARQFVQGGGHMDDIQMSTDVLAVEYRALQEKIAQEVRRMFKHHWDTKGVLHNQFLIAPAQLGPVTMRRRRRCN